MPEVENSEPSRFHPVNLTRTQSFSAGCSMPSPGASTFKKTPDVVFPAVEEEAGAATSGGGGSTACGKRSAWSGHAVAERGRREVQNAFDRRSRRAAHGAGRSCSDRGILEEENAFHRPAVRRGKRGDNRTIHRDWAIGEAKSLCQDECDSVAAQTAVALDVQAAPGENVGTGFEPDIRLFFSTHDRDPVAVGSGFKPGFFSVDHEIGMVAASRGCWRFQEAEWIWLH